MSGQGGCSTFILHFLPEFKGAHAIADALNAAATETGCTVHWVTEDMDAAPFYKQAKVPVFSRRYAGNLV